MSLRRPEIEPTNIISQSTSHYFSNLLYYSPLISHYYLV
jgi:hypothetical protein